MSHDADVRRLIAASRLLLFEASDAGVQRDVWREARLLNQLHVHLDAIHALHAEEMEPGLRSALRRVGLLQAEEIKERRKK